MEKVYPFEEKTMPSPFPGMNPYLEQDDVWHDFHERFIPSISDVLVPQVRPGYIVKLDEHVYIHERSAAEREFLGGVDVSVTRGDVPSPPHSSAAVLAAPVHGRIPTAIDVERLSFVEIRDRRSRELITVLEVLSPSNKRLGADREQYIAKRRQLFASSVHFVEIDLLRGGPRLPLEDLPDCDYCVLVSRTEERPQVGIWPLRLRERLPIIPIPLRAPDADARLDLQEALNRLYDAAGYVDYIYTGAPQPPLHPDDAAWARQLLPTERAGSVSDS
jgi:hypothetical protein